MPPNMETGSSSTAGSKPPTITRAGSAPPTRGRQPLGRSGPNIPVAPSSKSSTNASERGSNGLPPRPSAQVPKTALKRPKRMIPRDHMSSYCSLALSRTESVLVSSSGDVMVCRCRRSSTPYLANLKDSDIALMDPWTNLIQCCDAPDCIVEGPWSPVFSSLTVQHKLSGESINSEGSTYEWEKISPKSLPVPTTSTPPLKTSKVQKVATKKTSIDNEPTESTQGDHADKSLPETLTPDATSVPAEPLAVGEKTSSEQEMDFNAYDGGILPLPSFDYDHIHDGENDMLSTNDEQLRPKSALSSMTAWVQQSPRTPGMTPGTSRRKGKASFPTILESPEEKKEDPGHPEQATEQPFYHGIPVFLTPLAQIRISKVSANPMGAHVLLISKEALLFSYGLNNHGQLGIGIKSSLKDGNRGFHVTPTLITPLLENGGKVIHCAAGVDHSLVVVATEGRRLHRLTTRQEYAHSEYGTASFDYSGGDDPTISEGNESLRHHQVYGFGSNDFMKIGLVNAKLADDGAEGDIEDILLPRRVALHCKVWPDENDSVVPNEDGLSLPHDGIFDLAASAEHSAALVKRATGDIEVYMWGNATVGALGLPIAKESQVRIDGEMTERPISNANNIFPLPTVLESLTYRLDRDCPHGFPRQVSLGPYCSFVVMSTGKCMSFGFSAEGMLGHGYGLRHTMEAKEVFFPPDETKDNGIVAVSAGAYHAIALTQKGHAYSWGINSDDRLGHGTTEFGKLATKPEIKSQDLVVIEWVPQRIDLSTGTSRGKKSNEDSTHCIDACAGYDSSMLVARSGQVYSFGKRSGRLGKGEVAHDVGVPEPLHGGLRLFQNTNKKSGGKQDTSSRSRSNKPVLKRIQSDGAVFKEK